MQGLNWLAWECSAIPRADEVRHERQLDARIKACLNQDGNMGWQPFWLDESGRSMNQPYMTLDHLDPDPPDEVFSKMGTTREQYVARRTARQTEAAKKLYGTVAGGSYHVTIATPGRLTLQRRWPTFKP